jgi:5-methylcytosine-specific restriction endonuclease McrA
LRREHRHKNPERTKLVLKAWLDRNPEKRQRYARQNYERHKERFIKAAKEWAKNNPQKRSKIMAFQNAKRRSRKLANGGSGFSVAHWKELLTRSNGVCVYCAEAAANSVDHFVPLKLGGQDDYRNIVPACMKCNSAKRENEPRSWVINNYGEERLKKVIGIMFQ